MLADGRNGILLFKCTGNSLHAFAQRQEIWASLQNRQLGTQHQHIETLGLFIIVQQAGRQGGDVLAQFIKTVAVELMPGLYLGELFDVFALRPHHEIIHVHRSYLLVQQASHFTAQLRIA